MRPAGAMTAHGVLETERAASATSSRLRVLRSQGFLVLRPCNPDGEEPLTNGRRDVARVALAAGTAGPLGGDDFALDVHVGAGSTLVLTEVSAMIVLPGPHGDRSHMRVTVRVEEGATFVWLPKPIIAALGCDHDHDVRISLERNARMVVREETILGRHREEPGDFRTTLRITYEDRPLYHQQLKFGPDADGARSAAVLGENRAVGSVVAVDPAWTNTTPAASAFHRDAILAPLQGPGMFVSAVAQDSLQLRGLLDAGLDELGSRWRPQVLNPPREATTDTQGTPAG